MATSKVSAIRENTAVKMELIDFFKKKGWDSIRGSFLVSLFASCQGELESMLSDSFLASGGSLSAIVETAAFTVVFCRQ
jgi:hypothetical protein